MKVILLLGAVLSLLIVIWVIRAIVCAATGNSRASPVRAFSPPVTRRPARAAAPASDESLKAAPTQESEELFDEWLAAQNLERGSLSAQQLAVKRSEFRRELAGPAE